MPTVYAHSAFSWENFFQCSQLILQLWRDLSKLQQIKFCFFLHQKITGIYKTYIRCLKLVCVWMYACMFVKMFVWHLKPVTHTKHGPEIWCTPYRSIAKGVFIRLYNTLPTRLGIAWNKCELFRFEPKFLFIALQNMKTLKHILRKVRANIRSIKILYHKRKTRTIKQFHKKDYHCGDLTFGSHHTMT